MCVCFCQKLDNSICRSYSADSQFLHPSNYPEKIKSLAFNILLTCIYNPLSIDLPLCVLKRHDKPALLLHLISQNAVLECKLYRPLKIYKSWETSSTVRKFVENVVSERNLRGKNTTKP